MTTPQEYSIGNIKLNFDAFSKLVQSTQSVKDLGKIIKITGPFDGKINSIYRFTTETESEFIFRARISQAFRYESIIKEKVLFPFIDNKYSSTTKNLQKIVKKITETNSGSYLFTNTNQLPVIIPNLYYYDETKAKIPYIYSISEFIQGESLYYPMERDRKINVELLKSKKYQDIFTVLGGVLGKLHKVQFDGFYSDIRDIGDLNKKMGWKELFQQQLTKEMNEAQKHKAIQPLLPSIERFFKQNVSTIEGEDTPVLFHNDYQNQNFIIKEDSKSFQLNGLIDFDNWRIGPPAQDFIKIQYWTIKEVKELDDAFFKGYLAVHPKLNRKSLQNQVDVYKLLWFILVYNFEMDKLKKNELNTAVDQRFPSADKYLPDISDILKKNSLL
jgi:aminoglycoside phosphotransferase (APT) family kinase protein